jgi:hypothetical protein
MLNSAVKLPWNRNVTIITEHGNQTRKFISIHSFQKLGSTSGAIHRYVPVSAVIISVNDSSLARPKSASLTAYDLRSRSSYLGRKQVIRIKVALLFDTENGHFFTYDKRSIKLFIQT